MVETTNTAIAGNAWLIGLIGLIVGFILAYIFIKMTSGNVRKQLKTESELKQVKTEVEQQKAKIEEHFAESADLLKSLAQDYQRLYKHLAKSSVDLLPEETAKGIFNQTALLQDSEHSAVDITTETAATEDQSAVNQTENTADDKAPPKDYSKGSSGLLKAKS